MKNLDNYGVQELNAEQVENTDGGFILAVIAVVGIVIAIGEVNWDEAGSDMQDGWNSI